MKLSAYYNKVSIVGTISVLLIGGIIYFFAINSIARDQLDRDLSKEVAEVIEYIDQHQQLPRPADFDENETVFIKTSNTKINTRFFDTVYCDKKLKTKSDGRAVERQINFKGQNYKCIITISRESTEYMIQVIAIITLVLTIVLLTVLFLANRYLLNDIWQPFYGLIGHLKAFNVSEPSGFKLADNNVDEFNELDSAIAVMSSRVKSDFQNLKQFTENASHEMLTPLAVITSKLDTLIQDETLKPEQFDQIHDIYGAAGKLSRLNQSLLLLVKIENNLIDNTEQIDVKSMVTEKSRQFQELMHDKNIRLEQTLGEKEVTASKYLIDILLNNLFSNAIRHNNANGTINVSLSADKLIFENTGADTPLNGDTVFDRFQKSSKSEGTGLGLTIVKNICSVYNWDIVYKYMAKVHVFEISF